MEQFFGKRHFDEELNQSEALNEPPIKFGERAEGRLIQLMWQSFSEKQQGRLAGAFSSNDRIVLLESFPSNGKLMDLTNNALHQDSV